jgi:hypothetical protein
VSVDCKAVQGWFTETSLVRRAAEALFRACARRHLARFDQQAPGPSQKRILLGLVHQARATRFGLDHDFRRIRTVEDYRRLVPLCTRADLWRLYWQPVSPHLGGATWPGPLAALANGHTVMEEVPRPVGLSAALQAAHREALRTALALVLHARPRARLFDGCFLFLGDDPAGTSLWRPKGRHRGGFEERLPALVRPYAVNGEDAKPRGRRPAEAVLDELAERSARLPVTCLAGPAERLLPLLARVKQVRSTGDVAAVWPGLTAVLYTRRPGSAPAVRLREETGEGVLLLETVLRPEAPIAVEDPRCGMLRLLTDHGVYFEFVPPGPKGDPQVRHGLDEAEVGVPYELVLTSPAGLWACRTGRTVCLERRDPPLLRFVEVPPEVRIFRPLAAGVASGPEAAPVSLVVPVQPPHRQNGGSPAAPPGSSSRTPWSALADRE